MSLAALHIELSSALALGITPQYADKMLHAVPDAPVVDRVGYLLEAARGKVVLDVGIDGGLHAGLLTVARTLYGIDKTAPPVADPHFFQRDLDRCHLTQMPRLPDVELVICGEVLEHLANPGLFLDQLKALYPCRTIITVPNALGDAARAALRTGRECVNPDHVAWYSYTTLTTLLRRSGYRVRSFAWYNGRPLTAEGLLMDVG